MNPHTTGVDSHFIQDITYIKVPQSRKGKVHRTASIGELDDVWHRQANSALHGLGIIPYSVSGGTLHLPRHYDPNLRVAPLSLLDAQLEGDMEQPSSHHLIHAAAYLLGYASGLLIVAKRKVHAWLLAVFPTKYTLSRGVVVNWHTPVLHRIRRYGMPTLSAAIILMLAVVLYPGTQPSTPSTQQHEQHHGAIAQLTASSPRQSANTTDTSMQKSSSTNTTIPSGAATAANDTLTVASAPADETAAGGNAGGTSSNSASPVQGSSASNSSSIGVPGVTTPLPITVPGQSIGLGGKPIATTAPATITLN